MGAPTRPVARHRTGLAGFEAPRFVPVDIDDAMAQPVAPVGDLLRTHALIGRAALAVALVALFPSLHGDPDRALTIAWIVAGIWLPVVGLLDLATRRWGMRGLTLAALFWDVALFALVDIGLRAPASAAIGYLVITSFYAYTGGRRWAVAALGLCVAAALAGPLDRTSADDAQLLGIELVALVLVAWLFADVSSRHDANRAGFVRVSEKAAAIVAGIADAVVVTSRAGHITEWNPASSRTFGCSEREARQRGCSEVLGLMDGLRSLSCEGGCALLRSHEPGQSVELWRTDATGRRQPLLASATPVLDEDGTPVEVIHSFRDITALKAADEAKTMFLSTASHELKTPLTVIHGFAQVLRGNGVSEEVREHGLQSILERAEQLVGIVDRLLMSGRIDAGRIDLDLTPIDDLPARVRERVAAYRGATGREITLVLPDEIPAVFADPDAITTVLDHLLDNAMKYSPEGGAICVAVAVRDDEHVTVSVADEGIGMTEEQVDHCFERFWQAEGTDVRRFAGTGIGLYIVRSLVEAMHGTIEARSRLGSGTTFTLGLRTTPPLGPSEVPAPSVARDGESSMIREYMRQVGVPIHAGGGRS